MKAAGHKEIEEKKKIVWEEGGDGLILQRRESFAP